MVTVDDRDDDARDSKSLSGAVFHGSASQTSKIVRTELVASGSENTAFLDHGSDSLIEEESEPREANIDSVAAAADVASTAFNMDFGDVASEASNACMRPRSLLWSKARPSSRPHLIMVLRAMLEMQWCQCHKDMDSFAIASVAVMSPLSQLHWCHKCIVVLIQLS